MRPTISACVAVFNGSAFLSRALASIVGQSIRPDEILVLDDGSTDDSVEIARSFEGVRVIQQPNAGIGAARRRLVEEAKGDWIAFNDHDDWWAPEKLERMQSYTDDPGVSLIYSAAYFVDQTGATLDAPLYASPDSPLLRHIIPYHENILIPATLLRRAALLEVGNYQTKLRNGEDTLAYFMLMSKGGVVQVPDRLAYIFKRSDSISAPSRAVFEYERAVYLDYVLPNWDDWFGHLPNSERSEAMGLIQNKLAHLDSIIALWLDWEGNHRGAMDLYIRSFKRKPLSKGNIYRLLRSVAGARVRPIGARAEKKNQ